MEIKIVKSMAITLPGDIVILYNSPWSKNKNFRCKIQQRAIDFFLRIYNIRNKVHHFRQKMKTNL